MGKTAGILGTAWVLAMSTACGGAGTGTATAHVTTVTVKTLELAGDACGLPGGSVLHQFYVVNESRVVRGARLLPDSDEDGVADRDEAALGTDPANPRTSSSGCGDRVMQVLAADASACERACSAALAAVAGDANQLVDTDHDTLLDCEEAALGTDPNRADTDGDTLLDGVEIRFGTSPTADSRAVDSDHDGVSDAGEVLAGTDPFSSDVPEGVGYVYAPTTAATLGGAACFAYDVQNVDVLPTVSGENRVCAFVVAASAQAGAAPQAQRSCVWVKYVE